MKPGDSFLIEVDYGPVVTPEDKGCLATSPFPSYPGARHAIRVLLVPPSGPVVWSLAPFAGRKMVGSTPSPSVLQYSFTIPTNTVYGTEVRLPDAGDPLVVYFGDTSDFACVLSSVSQSGPGFEINNVSPGKDLDVLDPCPAIVGDPYVVPVRGSQVWKLDGQSGTRFLLLSHQRTFILEGELYRDSTAGSDASFFRSFHLTRLTEAGDWERAIIDAETWEGAPLDMVTTPVPFHTRQVPMYATVKPEAALYLKVDENLTLILLRYRNPQIRSGAVLTGTLDPEDDGVLVNEPCERHVTHAVEDIVFYNSREQFVRVDKASREIKETGERSVRVLRA